MIVLHRLRKTFDHLVAVDNISLTVAPGEILAVLGPNGAGKSTTMKMVTGFLAPTAGTAAVCGYDILTQPLKAKAKLGYLPEGAPSYGDMTPAGFLSFIADIRGYSSRRERTKRIAAVAERVALTEVLQQPINTLSRGFKRRVCLAQALLHDPEVLILDEPTEGLDPNQKHHVRGLIHDMVADKAIIVSTHILEEVEALSCRAIIIDRGRLVADGTAENLLANLPCHNAVTVTVKALEADVVEQKLHGLAQATKVERLSNKPLPEESRIRLRVLARDGQPIAAVVSDALRDHTLIALTVERGRLEDVFINLTLPG